MRKFLFAAIVLLSALGWAHQASATYKVCMQDFGGVKPSDTLPPWDGVCGDASAYKGTLSTIIQGAAPELQKLLADSAVCTWIFINPKPIGSSKPHLLNVELGSSVLSWVAWGQWKCDDGVVRNALFIGISALTFERRADGSYLYSLPIHETAELMQLFWWPGPSMVSKFPDYTKGDMPEFTTLTMTSKPSIAAGQLAIYAILAHEIGHYWQDRYGIYTNSGNGPVQNQSSNNACYGPTNSLTGFHALSWANYMAAPSEYFPPWEQLDHRGLPGGVWGCATQGSVIERIQQFIYIHLPFLTQGTNPPTDSTPNPPTDSDSSQGLIQQWPDAGVSGIIDDLYKNTNLPTVFAATSPEEDFAESYAMLSLYNAGLRSLCLSVPPKPNNYDVMYYLFRSNPSHFLAKAQWIATNLPEQKDSAGNKFQDSYGPITQPSNFPAQDNCQ